MEMPLVAAAGLSMALRSTTCGRPAARAPFLRAALAVLFFAAPRPESPIIAAAVAFATTGALLSARAAGEDDSPRRRLSYARARR